MENLEADRDQMIAQQVRTWDVLDLRVLDAMQRVPREQFVPVAWRSLAYADSELPLPCGKHMLTPMLVGRMLQALEVEAGAGDAPEELFTGDRTLQVLGLTWAALFALGVYVH